MSIVIDKPAIRSCVNTPLDQFFIIIILSSIYKPDKKNPELRLMTISMNTITGLIYTKL